MDEPRKSPNILALRLKACFQGGSSFSKTIDSAVCRKDLESVRKLVSSSSRVKKLDKKTHTDVLMLAIEESDVAYVESLKRFGLVVTRETSHRHFGAAASSSATVFSWLLNSEAPLPKPKEGYCSILGYAAAHADEALLRNLLERGAHMNEIDTCAAAEESFKTLQLFVRIGEAYAKSPAAFWADKYSALGKAIETRRGTETIPFLIERLGQVGLLEVKNRLWEFNGTPLVVAATFGKASDIHLLAQAGVNMQSPDAKHALISGIYKCQGDVTEALLHYGVEPNTRTIHSETALAYAASCSCPRSTRALLRAKADTELRGSKGETRTPLQIAYDMCGRKYPEDSQKILILLCANGARLMLREPLRRQMGDWVRANSELLRRVQQAETYDAIKWPKNPFPFIESGLPW